ncbi:methionine biosynthesis protein MetW [Candidatus Parabeggiatoa sp. HSG14]|uniref:methionine biosynthesis protein MetW n=1 Tax=Candidatus Parabeggiatoa sp. HSG14 TaxID=3055593 RepID=UPI0025A79029|nr:methionine biosynthesis protein MetW [Thiotrichales bacterium HSG14]
MRTDLALISEWIAEDSHVLDLGCGDGTLLAHLRDTCQVTGYGLEIDDDNLVHCIKAGVNAIHTDLNQGLSDFTDDSFDYVVMTQALQIIRRPDLLLMEMLRVGREGVVTFPNFGHWQARFSLFFKGVMPISHTLQSEWYNTENIRLCTLHDFEKLCYALDIEVLQRAVVDATHRTSWSMRLKPNLFGEIAIYRFRSKAVKRVYPRKSLVTQNALVST